MSILSATTCPELAGHATLIPADLIRFTEQARRGFMSLATLHRWRLRQDDPLPAWKLGGVWYLSESELSAWIARRSGRPSQSALSAPTPLSRRAEIVRA